MKRWQFTHTLGLILIGLGLAPVAFAATGQSIELLVGAISLFLAVCLMFILNGLMYQCPRCKGRVMKHNRPLMRILPPKFCPRCGVTLRWR